jgi:di/tricarboxylate transporter
MTPQIFLLLVILVIVLILFSIEWLAVDVVALGVLLAIIIGGLLPVDQALRGFGSETVWMIFGLFILTAALVRTGVIDMVGRSLLNRIGHRPRRMLFAVMLAVSTLSSFMSNTAATAFFVPIVMGLARRMRISPSRLLMPLAFAAILASSVTLIGTSTNLVVSGLMVQYNLSPMGMFELTPVGLPILTVGLLYIILIGRRMIPDRGAVDTLTEEFNLRSYLAEIIILPESPLGGKTLGESGLGRELDCTVVRILRDGEIFLAPQANICLAPGDHLLVEAQRDAILRIKDRYGLGVSEPHLLSDPDMQKGEMQLAEVILLPRSPLIGRRLIGLDLRDRYGLQVLAINRHEQTIHRRISQVPLQMGDVLLVQGSKFNLETLERNNTFQVLGMVEDRSPNHRRAPIAIAIFSGAMLLAMLEILPLGVAVLLGTLAAFLSRCITPEEAYRDVEWKAIILIGSMLAFGAAMDHTGTAKYLASQIVNWTSGLPPVWILSGFFLLTVGLTQPMSNQAAAAVVLPVAIQTAMQLGLNPRTFAMMIAVAASTSYITPLEPACLIVYGLGRYRFLDFLRVGSLLTVVIFFIAVWLVPVVWPF